MGLDGAEMLMGIEETFGIEIGDADASCIRTPGDIVALVRRKLASVSGPEDQRAQALLLLRRALVDLCREPEERVRAETPLATLFPNRDCTLWWWRLRDALQVRSRQELRRPRALRIVIASLSWGAFGGCAWAAYRSLGGGDGVLLGLIAGGLAAAVVAVALLRVTRAQRFSLPAGVRTVGDLIPLALTSPRIHWTDEAVAAEVKAIIVGCLHIKESQYAESASLVDDLGMD